MTKQLKLTSRIRGLGTLKKMLYINYMNTMRQKKAHNKVIEINSLKLKAWHNKSTLSK